MQGWLSVQQSALACSSCAVHNNIITGTPFAPPCSGQGQDDNDETPPPSSPQKIPARLQ